MMKQQSLFLYILTALFAALVILLGFTPLGMIPLGFINVTTLCLPVLIGALLLPGRYAVILGACFGLISVFKAITATTTLVAPILSGSLILTIVLSMIPRIFIPIVGKAMYKLCGKCRRPETVSLCISAVVGSLTNTVLYLGIMLLSYVILGIDTAPVLSLIAGIGLIAGGAEAIVAGVVVPLVVFPLRKYLTRYGL